MFTWRLDSVLRQVGAVLAFLPLVCVFQGCTLNKTLEVRSEPTGAQIQVDGLDFGVTPTVATLSFDPDDAAPHASRTVSVRKDGYETQSKKIGWREAKAAESPWKLDLQLVQLRDSITIRFQTQPPGASISLPDGKQIKTPATASVAFSRANGAAAWNSLDLQATLENHEPMAVRIPYDRVKATPLVDLALAKLRDEIPLELQCNVKDARLTLDGKPVSVGSARAVFTRASSRDEWTTLLLVAAADNYESRQVRLTHDAVKANPKIQIDFSDKLRETIAVEIKANVEEASISVDGKLIGTTPRSHEFVFSRATPRDEWDAHYVVVEKKEYTVSGDQAASMTSAVPFSTRLTIEDARKGVIDVRMERVRFYLTNISSILFGPEGARIQMEAVLSQIGEIEREPKAGTVTKMTAADEGNSLIVARIPLLADGNGFALVVPFNSQRDQSVLFSNLWMQKGQGRVRLTDADHTDTDANLSTDGNWMYFTSNRLSPRRHNIWRIATNGKGGLTKITDSPSSAADIQPAISPDGTKLAYSSLLQESKLWHVWVSNSDGTLPAQLRVGKDPAWSPDGKQLAYVAQDQQGRAKIWVMESNGSNPTQLTFGEQTDQYPTWTPDGRSIVFASDQGLNEAGKHHFDIWIMNADGSGKTQLTVNGSYDSCPSVSADGRYVYFFSNRGARRENDPAALQIWRMELPTAIEHDGPTTRRASSKQ